jgi:hypothetical protein
MPLGRHATPQGHQTNEIFCHAPSRLISCFQCLQAAAVCPEAHFGDYQRVLVLARCRSLCVDLRSGAAEVTAALDEAAEAALYRPLHDRLKGTAIISIGHRSTLNVFHRRRIEVVPDDGFSHLQDVPLVPAAE